MTTDEDSRVIAVRPYDTASMRPGRMEWRLQARTPTGWTTVRIFRSQVVADRGLEVWRRCSWCGEQATESRSEHADAISMRAVRLCADCAAIWDHQAATPLPTTVVHVRDDYDVYIGRAVPRRGYAASPWANPFRIGPDGDRDTVIRRYAEYIQGRSDLLAMLPELRGKRLGCWCAPERCHGDVLAALADGRPLPSWVEGEEP